MSACIICLRDHESTTVEHIVPRALGNIHYVLRKGCVCSKCNNKFAKYEHAVLNSQDWLVQRKKMGLAKESSLPNKGAKTFELQRFLLKIFYESMYHSRRKVFDALDLEDVRLELDRGIMVEREVFKKKRINQSDPVPRFMDRWRLRQNGISLNYRVEPKSILFEFVFYDLTTVVII